MATFDLKTPFDLFPGPTAGKNRLKVQNTSLLSLPSIPESLTVSQRRSVPYRLLTAQSGDATSRRGGGPGGRAIRDASFDLSR
ncbi:hypothetical protein NL676_004788 [Syzygium grande]|nr:hypothetical protein NL676_004788 [Syzygium grande]